MGSHPARDIRAERRWPCGPFVRVGWSPQEAPAATSPSVQLLQPPRGLIDGLDKPAGGTCSEESSPDQTPSRCEAWPQRLQLCRAPLELLGQAPLAFRSSCFPKSTPSPILPTPRSAFLARPMSPAGGREGRGNETPPWLGWLLGPCSPDCWGRTEDRIRG